MDAQFFDLIRQNFGGHLSQDQVDGINAIIAAWDKYGDGDARKLAYLLATARHETAGTMQPIYERGAVAYFGKYEPGTKIGNALGNTLKGDGYRFRGRGFVQLTGRENYAKAGKALGVDLIADPDRALEPVLAATILIRGCLEGWFTGRKLGTYITPAAADYVNARRVVNGTDKADLIATYAHDFARALVIPAHETAADTQGTTGTAQARQDRSAASSAPDKPLTATAGVVAALVAIGGIAWSAVSGWPVPVLVVLGGAILLAIVFAVSLLRR